MIAVLMATYNGEKYIEKQIVSIMEQTMQNFVLHVCDDASTDTTYSILQRLANRYPQHMQISRNQQNSGGSKNNFMQMILRHREDYIFLCDQDDFWLADKMERSLAKLQALEQRYGKELPLLVHTDLRIVDERLQTLHSSFWSTNQIGYRRCALRKLLMRSVATGCTMLYNRALASRINHLPTQLICMTGGSCWWPAHLVKRII